MFLREIEVDLRLGGHQLSAKQSWSLPGSLLELVDLNVTVPGVLRHNHKPVTKLHVQIPLTVLLDYLVRLNSPDTGR